MSRKSARDYYERHAAEIKRRAKEIYDPEKNHLAKYGITLNEYNRLAKEQNYHCAICGREDWACSNGKLCVDHCHETGHIRGLLCTQCNTLIGLAGDNSNLLALAAGYLDARA